MRFLLSIILLVLLSVMLTACCYDCQDDLRHKKVESEMKRDAEFQQIDSISEAYKKIEEGMARSEIHEILAPFSSTIETVYLGGTGAYQDQHTFPSAKLTITYNRFDRAEHIGPLLP